MRKYFELFVYFILAGVNFFCFLNAYDRGNFLMLILSALCCALMVLKLFQTFKEINNEGNNRGKSGYN